MAKWDSAMCMGGDSEFALHETYSRLAWPSILLGLSLENWGSFGGGIIL